MPSRAEWRRRAEWALRAALVVLLAVALWRSVRASRPGATSVTVNASALGDALQRATTSQHVGSLNVNLDASLTSLQRHWLLALRRAGMKVNWHGSVPALALSADRAREPIAPARIRVVTDGGGVLALSDSVGVIDSVRGGHGTALEVSDVAGPVSVRQGAFAASTRVPAREDRRGVLVLGRAGWESRFVLAALGEAGWRVRGRLPVAPGVAVVDASLLPIDTAKYDVVIALDSTAADLAPAVARFVAQGGGAILLTNALEIGAFQSVAPARIDARRPGRILLDGDTLTRGDLPLYPLVNEKVDAVRLERQPAGLAVTIRRAGRGRVAAVGYDESWRWRMQGGAAGEAAHREWWSRLVGLVAPARPAPGTRSAQAGFDPVPRAALIAALGPPSSAAEANTRRSSSRLPLMLLVLALVALLAETASRRFRGAS